MSTDANNGADDQVDRAILAALRARGDEAVFSEPEKDEALISAVVTAHLQVAQLNERRRRVTPWLAATGLLAAAAAAAVIWFPTNSGSVPGDAPAAAQASTSAPTQAMWVLEHKDTPLEGVVVTTERETCGTRNDTRACLSPSSRGTFEADGNLRLHEGTARVEALEPIIVFLSEARVRAATDTASFSATLRAGKWTVSVERGTVTVTDPDGLSQVLEAGESASSEPPGAAAPLATAEVASPPAAAPKHSNPASAGESQKPALSADELLTLARSQRAAKEFEQAARTYEQLVRAYPNSKKVRATLVSLAQLYQGPLDDPAKALRHFEHYLQRGGPLAEEAHYGKIRALRSLGRTAAADTEAEAFLRTFPDSAHADALRN